MDIYTTIMKAIPSQETTFKKHWMKHEHAQKKAFAFFAIINAFFGLLTFICYSSLTPNAQLGVYLLSDGVLNLTLMIFSKVLITLIALWSASLLDRLIRTWRSINVEKRLKLRQQELTTLLESKTKRLDYRQAVVEEQHPTKYSKLLEVGGLPADVQTEVDELSRIEKLLGIERHI